MLDLIATILAVWAIGAQDVTPPNDFDRHIDRAEVTYAPTLGLTWPGHRGDDWHWAGLRLADLTPQTGP